MRTKQAHRRRHVARIVDGSGCCPVFRSYPTLYVSSAVRARAAPRDLADGAHVPVVRRPPAQRPQPGRFAARRPPDVVVSHELDVLKYVAAGYRRSQLLTLVLEHSRANAAAGRKSWGYSYAVPGQWQGRYDRLEVVGDKRGRRTTARLRRATRAARAAGATRRRAGVGRAGRPRPARQHRHDVATGQRAARGARSTTYFSLSDTVDDRGRGRSGAVPPRAPGGPHRRSAERARRSVRVPRRATADPAYLAACASIVFESPPAPRDDAPWTPELVADVGAGVAAHDWLAPYLDAVTEVALPTFVVIGAMRSGSTSLYKHLQAHPDVFMPRKEIHFFDDRWDRGLAWYRSRFEGYDGQPAVGEATPTYLADPVALDRMAEMIPDARLLAVLRDPVDRAYSHYWMEHARGRDPRTFEQAVADELAGRSAGASDYLAGGATPPNSTRSRRVPPLPAPCPPPRRPPRPARRGLRRSVPVLGHRRHVRTAPPRRPRQPLRRLPFDAGAGDTSLAAHSPADPPHRRPPQRSPGHYEPMAAATREHLRRHFAADNAALARWLGRDLSAWSVGALGGPG